MIIRKTVKELLAESLTELLGSKSFEKITVNEIAENCGVGRRTFYNNFRDKYELAAWLYIKQLKDFVDSSDDIRLKDFIRYSTEVVNKDLQIIIAIDKYRGQNNFRDSLTEPMTDLYVRVIENLCGSPVEAGLRQMIEFFICGQISYVGMIIENPVVPTPEEVTGFFISCIPEPLKQFL